MNTTQISTAQKTNKLTSFGRFYKETGFDAYRRRIAALLSAQGTELAEDDDEALYNYYRCGENETFVMAAFGCDYCN
ncbi:MAG: hypothetical protein M0P13_07370 [Fibrobacteraceae bacterium]|nr:hypothetical protein [Fibrobacteraceae bacterium]